MKIILWALLCAQLGFASTLSYLQEITELSHDESKILDKKILKQSKNLDFLKCPIKLIEQQINGPESVQKGIEYLLDFLYQSTQADPDYQNIHDNCLDTLEEYTLHKRRSSVRGRPITVSEIQNLEKHFARENQLLISLIIKSINQATLCYTNKIAVSASFLVSFSVGGYEMQCYTPLGRRFTLQGPSVGLGSGLAGASMTLPNTNYLNNPLSYRFFLFNRAPKDPWYTTYYSHNFVCGLGTEILQDRNQVFQTDLRAAIGINFSCQKSYQIMSRKSESSYYLKLIQSQLFEDMANTAYNIK